MRKIYNTIVILLVVAAAVACGWEDPLAGLAGPEHEVIKPKTRGFTVMSYNIYGARGLTLDADYEALASVIRYVNPDFVLLQEVDSCTRRQAELPCNSAKKLTEILDTTTVYDWSYNYSPAEYNLYSQGGAYGDAILTKHKILWEKDYQLSYAPEHNGEAQKEKRSANVIKVSINDKDANNNGHLNPGETVKLSVSIHNDSAKEYNNIKAVISCSNEDVTITDAEAVINNIAANGDVTLSNEFEIVANEDISYESELYFNIDFYENTSVVSSSTFPIEVRDSELVLASFIVKNDDNENGILEAGETADLGLVLNNIGNEIAVKVKGSLSSSSNYITLNQTEAEFSSIGGNSSGVAFFNITVSEDLDSSVPFTLKASDLYGEEYEFSESYAFSCGYIFQLSDSYSDGWNGAALLVKYDSGRPTDTLTLASGSFGEFRLNIESNVEVTLEWMGKDQYDNECKFIVMKDNYVAVYMSPTLSPTTSFLCSWVNDCSCKYEYQEMCDAVKDLKGGFICNDIVLNWTTDNGLQTTVFEVYRGTVLVGTTEETSFTESGLAEGEYVYSVRAIYEDCNGLFSDVTVKTTESTIENSAIKASIYPNPSKDNFTIVCDNMTYIAVYNVVGNKVMETNIGGSDYVINGLESGVYFVEIKTNEGNLVKRILKF